MVAMKTAKAKLVTIILPFSWVERLTQDLREMGASGYTLAQVNGFGVKGMRTYGLTDGANTRLETIVSAARCEKILDHLSARYVDVPFVAYAHDVEAIPTERFGS